MKWTEQIYLPATRQSALFKICTTPLAWLFGCLVRVRNLMFDCRLLHSRQLDVPVIAIGNLAVGGTGKTPFVGFIAQHLKEKGYRPAILTRGYGSGLRRGDKAILVSGKLQSRAFSQPCLNADEPRMLSVQLPDVPVVLCADRFKGARYMQDKLPHYPVTHWILDDGFQHRQLRRDIDIVLIDAESAIGNGYTLPRGFLREPLKGLHRADAVVYTRANDTSPLNPSVVAIGKMLKQDTAQIFVRYTTGELRHMAGPQRTMHNGVNVVCAIARPERLLSALEQVGLTVFHKVVYRDHAQISADDIRESCDPELPVITTEKDYWRDPELFHQLGFSVHILPISVQLGGADLATIDRLLKI